MLYLFLKQGEYGVTLHGIFCSMKHAFCPICTSKYIIEKEEHICPICRRSFHGSKNSLEKNVYEVIEEDKILYDQARAQII